jgi:ribose transport system permease protein
MLIILGGSGSYIGTIAGCIIMVLIQSLLPIFAIPEAGRRIISGGLILLLLLLYGRARQRLGIRHPDLLPSRRRRR